MLAWSRAKSQFHSLALAAIFLRVVVIAGVWVSLFLSKSHTTILVCGESELQIYGCLSLTWSVLICSKI